MVDIRWWDEESGERVYLHDARNTHELQEAELEIRRLAAQHEMSSRSVIGGNSTDEHGAQLLLDNGYKQVFSLVYMELRDLYHLPAVSLSSEFELRSAASEDVRRLWELNNVAYSGRDFVGVATESGLEKFRNAMSDLSLVTVAQYAAEVAGFVASSLHDDYAEVNEVTVHPDYRRRGLATAMLSTNLRTARERGVNRARLHTNGEDVSGARSLYAKFGFESYETHLRFRKRLS